MSYAKVKLGGYIDILSGFTFKSKDFTDTGIPVIKIKNVQPPYVTLEDLSYVPNDIAEKSQKFLLQYNDVLIALTGSHINQMASVVGRVARVKYSLPSLLNQRVGKITSKNNALCDIDFVYYYLSQNKVKIQLAREAGGAANQANISPSDVKDLEIPFPCIEIQRRIADILSAYDNLIENNQKQIKLLEEAAQRLYKEWFVDLRFPGYETTPVVDGVPEGWELCHLEDVIEFNPKVPLSKERLKQSVPMSALSTSSMTLDTEEFAATFSNSGSKFQNGDTLLARITPCLENGKTAFVAGVESDEGAVGSTEFIVMRSKGINPYMVYLLARNDSFRQSAINSMTGSDGRQRAQADKLKALPYLKPADQIMMLFARYVEPMFIQIQKKNEQNVRLRQARDRLLPKLMSGEVEV